MPILASRGVFNTNCVCAAIATIFATAARQMFSWKCKYCKKIYMYIQKKKKTNHKRFLVTKFKYPCTHMRDRDIKRYTRMVSGGSVYSSNQLLAFSSVRVAGYSLPCNHFPVQFWIYPIFNLNFVSFQVAGFHIHATSFWLKPCLVISIPNVN